MYKHHETKRSACTCSRYFEKCELNCMAGTSAIGKPKRLLILFTSFTKAPILVQLLNVSYIACSCELYCDVGPTMRTSDKNKRNESHEDVHIQNVNFRNKNSQSMQRCALILECH